MKLGPNKLLVSPRSNLSCFSQTQAGEIFALPSVVFITIMAQPRLTYALSRDGLLPDIFGTVDKKGNLRNGALISGGIMIVVSTFVPFAYLDDLISSGILVAFSMTDWSLVALRYDPPSDQPLLLNQQLALFNALAFATGMVLTHIGFQSSNVGLALVMLGAFSMIYIVRDIARKCEPSKSFGGSTKLIGGLGGKSGDKHQMYETQLPSETYFETPFVPYLPCMGMFLNWYLVTQMEWFGVLLLLLYLSFAAAIYFSYGIKHSIGNTTGWVR
jgi:amino acid transporter